MDNTYQTEIRRTFLIQGLPKPLTPASSHLQIFDNYIENTRLRIRKIRVPEEKKWSWNLEHRFPLNSESLSKWKISHIYLNEDEYKIFKTFEGREIRKNRYFYDLDKYQVQLDVYLGKLWGLNLMNVHFSSTEEMDSFEIPLFVIFEVTNYSFFTGENLVDKTFTDLQEEFKRIHENNKDLESKREQCFE